MFDKDEDDEVAQDFRPSRRNQTILSTIASLQKMQSI
jgi:hypothetical protein